MDDDLRVAPGVAEELQRDSEDLGEERRDRVVAPVATRQHLPDLGALVVGVRPVLDSSPATEERVEEVRDVAGSVDVWDVGLEALVDDDAVVDLDPAALEEVGHRRDAD